MPGWNNLTRNGRLTFMEHARKPVTVAEFLGWHDGTDIRHELVDGVIVAMAPSAPMHGVIAARAIRLLGSKLRPPCEPISEPGVQTTGETVRHVDVAVICGEVGRKGTVEPPLVVEVLSPSTRDEDRTVKLDEYKALPFMEEIWLVDSERRWVQLLVRQEEAWVVSDHVGGGRFRSPFLRGEVELDILYGGLAI